MNTLKECQAEFDELSNGDRWLVYYPKFWYDFGDDFYSCIEFCKFLLELQYNYNSQFPISVDITAEELSILENYDSGFQKFLEDKTWFSYVQRFNINNIVNYFLEDHKDKIYISRKDVWDVLLQLENMQKDNFPDYFFFLVILSKKKIFPV